MARAIVPDLINHPDLVYCRTHQFLRLCENRRRADADGDWSREVPEGSGRSNALRSPIPNYGRRNSPPDALPDAGRGETIPPCSTPAYRNRIRDGPTTVSRPVRSIASTLCSRSRTNAMTAPRPEVAGRNKTKNG